MAAQQIRVCRSIFARYRYIGTQMSSVISGVTRQKFTKFLHDVALLLMHTSRQWYCNLFWNVVQRTQVVSVSDKDQQVYIVSGTLGVACYLWLHCFLFSSFCSFSACMVAFRYWRWCRGLSSCVTGWPSRHPFSCHSAAGTPASASCISVGVMRLSTLPVVTMDTVLSSRKREVEPYIGQSLAVIWYYNEGHQLPRCLRRTEWCAIWFHCLIIFSVVTIVYTGKLYIILV